MAKQLINLGTSVNDGTGDTLRIGAEKINENFTELYDYLSNATGQFSLVTSVITGDGLHVNSTTGNITISAKIATSTELGVVKVGNGLEISPGGVLSATVQTQFSGSYTDLTDTPDLSVFQLSMNAFSGDYDDLINKPVIPNTLVELGIQPGAPGQVLVADNSGSGAFTTLFDQSLFTTSQVNFESVEVNSSLVLDGDYTITQQLIISLTGQRDSLQNGQLPSLELQFTTAQSNYNYWIGILNSSQPGSPEWYQAESQVSYFSNMMGNLNAQIGMVQGQIATLNSEIGYYQSILSIVSTSIHFDHPSQSVIFESSIVTPSITLTDSNSITSPAGIRLNSVEDLMILANGKGWTFGVDGNISLPINGDILDSNGASVLSAPFNQSLNTTDNATFNSVTAEEFVSSSTGVPTITSATNLNLTAAGAVVITNSPIRIANLTTAQRNEITAINGDMIYNSSINRLQFIQDNVIQTVRTTVVEDIASNIYQDIATCGVNGTESWSQEDTYGRTFTFHGVSNIVTNIGYDVAYFMFDPAKFSGGVLEFVADDVNVNTPMGSPATVTVHNRYYGTVKFGVFNDGVQDNFAFDVNVIDTLNSSNYNFQASILSGSIPSTQGPVPGVALQVRKLADISEHAGQLSFKWKATMFSAEPQVVSIYTASFGLL